ncbi:hypothetical protein PMAYCL1PPCAC_08578, partial [Pristionchus mayeri]
SGGYRAAFRSVMLNEIPETNERVRAHLYLGAVQLRPHPDHPDTKTICDFITLIDLKGLLPKFIVNKKLPSLVVEDAEAKVKRFKEVAK